MLNFTISNKSSEAAAVVAHHEQFLNMALIWYVLLQLTDIRNNNRIIMNVL